RVSNWLSVDITAFLADVITDTEFVLTRVGSGAAPVRESAADFANLKLATYTGLRPGDYLLQVRVGNRRPEKTRREQAYSIRLSFRLQTPPGPDGFEVNEWINASYDFGTRRGTFRANTHNAYDNDCYRFQV